MLHDDYKIAENLCNYSFTVDRLNRFAHLITYLLVSRYSWVIPESGILIIEPITKRYFQIYSQDNMQMNWIAVMRTDTFTQKSKCQNSINNLHTQPYFLIQLSIRQWVQISDEQCSLPWSCRLTFRVTISWLCKRSLLSVEVILVLHGTAGLASTARIQSI